MEDIRILIAEDDPEICSLAARYLEKEGYRTDCARNGMEALNLLSSNEYKLIILDLMMPYIDGYEVLRKTRESRNNVPVVIVSARAEKSDKIIGLELGADDYLVKPFSIDELIARAKAQIRRYTRFNNPSVQSDNTLKYKDIEMNTDSYELTIGGRSIALTSKEFDILKLFLANPRKIFTKANVFNSVWGEEYLGDENTVMVHIRRLREKIEADPSNPRYIQTVWGIGYKLAEV